MQVTFAVGFVEETRLYTRKKKRKKQAETCKNGRNGGKGKW